MINRHFSTSHLTTDCTIITFIFNSNTYFILYTTIYSVIPILYTTICSTYFILYTTICSVIPTLSSYFHAHTIPCIRYIPLSPCPLPYLIHLSNNGHIPQTIADHTYHMIYIYIYLHSILILF